MAFNFISTILIGLGVTLLVFGFNRFKKIKLIEDTPRSLVRSIAMGLVEIHCKVKALSTIKTPFSQVDCIYYRYEIKEYRERVVHDSKGRSRVERRWETVSSGSQQVPFLAFDDTGEVRVSPQGAEFHVTVKKVFLQRAGVFGAFNVIKDLLKNWDTKKTETLDMKKWNLEPLDPQHHSSFVNHVGDRKYFEWYIAPNESLFIIGTADHDAEDKVELRRGENEKTFLISDKSEKELLGSLTTKMWLFWVLGSLVVVLGAYILFNSLGVV